MTVQLPEFLCAPPKRVGLCLACNYPLRLLPENRCPECGSAFDPNDAATMNMGRPMGPVVRRIVGPAGLSLVTLMFVAASCLVLWRSAQPAFYYMGSFMVLWFGLPMLASLVVIVFGVRGFEN
jgi:hypothetical protein